MDSPVPVEHLRFQAGDDEPAVWDLADKTSGNPANLDGYTARAQVRRRVDDTTVLHEWSAVNGRAVVSGSTVTLKVDDSEDWTWSFGFYDLRVIDPVGRSTVILRGTVTVDPAVTR